MAWVKLILKGYEFFMETVQMCMFISEEASQTASMAMGTAITNGKTGLAQEISATTLTATNNLIWYYVALYGMGIIPSWNAFYCFFYMNRLNIMDLEGKMDALIKLDSINRQMKKKP